MNNDGLNTSAVTSLRHWHTHPLIASLMRSARARRLLSAKTSNLLKQGIEASLHLLQVFANSNPLQTLIFKCHA